MRSAQTDFIQVIDQLVPRLVETQLEMSEIETEVRSMRDRMAKSRQEIQHNEADI